MVGVGETGVYDGVTRQQIMTLTPNMQMSRLSLAYISAVAADVGCEVWEPTVDFDSVDGVLVSNAGRRPRIEFQAKSTTQDVLSGGELHFPLPLKNYDDLRADTMVPRLLIVMLMPAEPEERLIQSPDQLCLRKCAYWYSLEGQPSTGNTSSVTVRIPTQNEFTTAQLTTLLQKVDQGVSLC